MKRFENKSHKYYGAQAVWLLLTFMEIVRESKQKLQLKSITLCHSQTWVPLCFEIASFFILIFKTFLKYKHLEPFTWKSLLFSTAKCILHWVIYRMGETGAVTISSSMERPSKRITGLSVAWLKQKRRTRPVPQGYSIDPSSHISSVWKDHLKGLNITRIWRLLAKTKSETISTVLGWGNSCLG